MASSNQQKTDAEKKLDGEFANMDIYGLFDVDPEATDKVILKAYRKKALKCHPDKNPDNPKAADMFHTLSRALEILTDVPARAAYDKILKAKKAADIRHKVLDSKRKKFKEDLEAREKKASGDNMVHGLTQTEKLQKEIDRLRKEGSRMLEDEQERLRQEIQKEKQNKGAPADEPPRLKLKWRAEKGDLQNGGYSHETLHSMFDKYGQISALIVSRKKLGSAIIEFAQPGAAVLAYDNEHGLLHNALIISWLSGKPENSHERPDMPFTTPQANSDVPSGFSFSSSVPSTVSNGNSNTVTTQESTSRETVDLTKDVDQSAGTAVDFESLVLRNLRQAQERKRLQQEILNEED